MVRQDLHFGSRAVPDMIQSSETFKAPKPQPRIMRGELSDYGWTAIKPCYLDA